MDDDKEYYKDFVKEEFLTSDELIELLEMSISKSNHAHIVLKALHNILIRLKALEAKQ